MAWERHCAAAFRLDDEGWARHANPASGWSRLVTGLPLIVLAAWSRVWIGWWAAAVFALVVLWLWLNPRLFPPAASDRAWMTRVVLGERLWIRRNELHLPEARTHLPHVFNALAGVSSLGMVYGLVFLEPVPATLGAIGAFAFKVAFVQRMGVLYERAKARDAALAYRRPQ